MSGHPNKTPLDIMKYRNAYLGNLKLEAQINQMNLNANKIYKKTGQTPAEKTDERTIEEKYADLEGLKLGIRKSLAGFADNRVAEEITQELDTLGGDDIVFASNNMSNLIEILKKHYSNGLANATQFFETYDKFKAKMDETKGVGEVGNATLMRNVQMILDNMVGKLDLTAIEDLINDSAVANRKIARDLKNTLTTLIGNLPTGADIEAINAKTDPILRAQLMADLQVILNELPTKAELGVEMNRLSIAIRAGDDQYQAEILAKIQSLLALDPLVFAEMETIRLGMEQKYKQRTIGFKYLDPKGNLLGLKKVDLEKYARNLMRLGAIGDYNPFEGMSANFKNMKLPELQDFVLRNDDWVRDKFGLDLPTDSGGKATKGVGLGLGIGLDIGVHRLRGTGVATRKTQVSYRIKPEDVDFTQGIDQMPKYIKFGRYLIHKPKLEDNIIKITTNSGAGITGLKPERVSRHFGGVIKKIVNGLNPTYEEIGGLTDAEKDYLYKLAKKSQILDRLSIPAPNKSKDDKLADRFDILKGEIQAGNNSSELIKEFKTLLLNLSNKDLIPKSQAKDILMDLVSMGY